MLVKSGLERGMAAAYRLVRQLADSAVVHVTDLASTYRLLLQCQFCCLQACPRSLQT